MALDRKEYVERQLKPLIWDFKSEFSKLDSELEQHRTYGDARQANPLINRDTVHEYIETAFQQTSELKQREAQLRKLGLIEKMLKQQRGRVVAVPPRDPVTQEGSRDRRKAPSQ